MSSYLSYGSWKQQELISDDIADHKHVGANKNSLVQVWASKLVVLKYWFWSGGWVVGTLFQGLQSISKSQPQWQRDPTRVDRSPWVPPESTTL